MVLEGVARLVGGDPHRGERPAGVDGIGEAQDLRPRVVVIGERPRHLLDGHLGGPGRIEDVPGGRGPRQGRRFLRRRREGGVDPPLGPHRQEHRRGDGEHVGGVEVKEGHRDS